MPFSKDDLQKLVVIVGDALKSDDAHITQGTSSRPLLYDDKRPPGILRLYNERYYEYVIAKSLIESFHLRVVLQVVKKGHPYDLGVFETNDDDSLIALGEIKCWWYAEDESHREIHGINRDVKRLREVTCSSFLIVITHSIQGETPKNYRWLKTTLGLAGTPSINHYEFVTKTVDGGTTKDVEMGVFGFLVKPK